MALSADGDTALIGGNGDHFYAGAAWIFARSATSWTQQGRGLGAGSEIFRAPAVWRQCGVVGRR